MIELRDAHDPSPNVTNNSVMLMWTDPPYGTQKVQAQGGKSYKDYGTADSILHMLDVWNPKLHQDATVAICLDYRLVHEVIVGTSLVHRGDVIWTFGLGRPRTSWWPNRHNTVATFTKSQTSGLFDPSAIPRERRLAPKEGYTDDKCAGSVWDFTMSNTHADRQGYPNQKPVELITPFIMAHTRKGDLVCDPYAGSGATCVAAKRMGRRYYGSDTNPEAISVATNWLETQ